MRETFLDPVTGEGWLEGQTYTRVKLADTLETLAEAGDEGADMFYNGTIGDMLVSDLQNVGGIITREDMARYQPVWQTPISVQLGDNMTLVTVPPPGSGAVLAAILNIMQVIIQWSCNYPLLNAVLLD